MCGISGFLNRDRERAADEALLRRMTEAIVIRAATAADAGIIARHRVAMFQDMGTLPKELAQPLRDASQRMFAQAIPSGEYVGWIATPAGRPAEVIAGAGVHVRSRLPRVDRARARVDEGPQALIVNVYTERPWRRRGVAERLMRTVLDWTRARGIDDVVLHASPEGRALYERLGFTPTNEMRYTKAEA